jgi:hypothetical protein
MAERDAAPAGLTSSVGHSGGVGAPPGWPLRAACQELADDPGKCPDESAARRRDKNAAVERREARALPQEGRHQTQRMRQSALRPLVAGGERE